MNVVTNNKWGISTHWQGQHGEKRISDRGKAFGLEGAGDNAGAFLGPLLAVGLMLLWAGDFRTVFWFAVIPAIIAVVLLIFGVEEPGTGAHTLVFAHVPGVAKRHLEAGGPQGQEDRRVQPGERHAPGPAGAAARPPPT